MFMCVLQLNDDQLITFLRVPISPADSHPNFNDFLATGPYPAAAGTEASLWAELAAASDAMAGHRICRPWCHSVFPSLDTKENKAGSPRVLYLHFTCD